MDTIDWRALYASNRAAIERAGGPRLGDPPSLAGLGSAPVMAPPVMAPPPAAARGGGLPRPASARGALVHVPATLDRETPAPLVCMLHGCTQDPASFAAATQMNAVADRHGFVVLYPGQDRGANPQGCWNWFLPEHQERDRGEPARIAATVRDLIAAGTSADIDERRVFVAGLSSGGAMAAVLAATYPDLIAAVAVHSGLAYRSATSMPAAFAAMARGGEDPTLLGPAAHAAMGPRARPVPCLVIHGDADETVAPVNGEQVLRQSIRANLLAGGHPHDPERPSETERGAAAGGLAFTRSRWRGPDGALEHERLLVHGLGHAWSGGARGGSHADPRGPSACEAIWRFCAEAMPGPED